MGPLILPVLDFWWCLLWISKPALFTFGRSIHVTHSPMFTSGVTPTNLLAASMATHVPASRNWWASKPGTIFRQLFRLGLILNGLFLVVFFSPTTCHIGEQNHPLKKTLTNSRDAKYMETTLLLESFGHYADQKIMREKLTQECKIYIHFLLM